MVSGQTLNYVTAVIVLIVSSITPQSLVAGASISPSPLDLPLQRRHIFTRLPNTCHWRLFVGSPRRRRPGGEMGITTIAARAASPPGASLPRLLDAYRKGRLGRRGAAAPKHQLFEWISILFLAYRLVGWVFFRPRDFFRFFLPSTHPKTPGRVFSSIFWMMMSTQFKYFTKTASNTFIKCCNGGPGRHVLPKLPIHAPHFQLSLLSD